uniref:Secreted protein n=1 Tax=Parascaris univalens TaxID=6257 RepID=A0A914ZYL5_PARUN
MVSVVFLFQISVMESSISVIICIFVTILLSSLPLVVAYNTVEIPLCKDARNPTLQIVCSQLHRWNSAVRVCLIDFLSTHRIRRYKLFAHNYIDGTRRFEVIHLFKVG